MVLPIILRGMRERAMDLKKKAAVTCGRAWCIVPAMSSILFGTLGS